MSPEEERERLSDIWARTLRTFLAACLEHQSPDVAVTAILNLTLGTMGPPYFKNTAKLFRAVEYLRNHGGLSVAYTEVLSMLFNFYMRYLHHPVTTRELPTCAELEAWYSETRGKARDLLERRAL